MKQITRRNFTELIALGALAGCVAPPPKPAPIDWTLYSPDRYGAATDAVIPWRLVAMSDLIVRGTVAAPSEAVMASAKALGHSVALTLAASRVIKGNFPREMLEVEYSPGRPDEPWPAAIVAASGRESLAFLMNPSDDEGAGGLYYFTAHGGSALALASATVEHALVESVALQTALASDVADRMSRQPPPFNGYIGGLVDKLSAEATAFDAAQELLSLGPVYAAALVRHMDDRRQIALGKNGVMAPSKDGQPPRQYWPKVVVDLLSLALQQATGDRLGATANGGAERARRRVVEAWRVWLGRSLRLQAG